MNPFKAIANFFRRIFAPMPKQPVEPLPKLEPKRPEPEDLPVPELGLEPIKPEVQTIDLVLLIQNIEKAFKLKLSAKQIDSIILIVKECEKQGLKLSGDTDEDKAAYIFATAYHETNVKKAGGPLVPITEQGSSFYLRSKKYWPYIGRGFVQLTWFDNYKKYSKIMNQDLVSDPDIVLDPQVSAFILVHGMIHGVFTGKSLGHYFNDRLSDPLNARRIINGTDKKELIAGYHNKFKAVLKASRARMPEVLA